ncbi:MAG: hypothetical protein U0X20_17180 [Caldilineaceae bacterium]
MSDNRQPTRPPAAQRRQGTAATYPLAPLKPTPGQWKRATNPAPDTTPRRKPLTNYVAFTKDTLGRWHANHHMGKTTTPVGMNGYVNADAAFREIIALGRMGEGHILLTRDFLTELYADWDDHDRQAQSTPRAEELP